MSVLRVGGHRDPWFGVLVERLKVAHPADRHAGCERLGVEGQTCQREVPAVRPSRTSDPAGIGITFADEEGRAVGGIVDPGISAVPVVGVGEQPAGTSRAAHVRREDGDACLEQGGEQEAVVGPGLGFGSAVEVDECRLCAGASTLARPPLTSGPGRRVVRVIEPARQRHPVAGEELDVVGLVCAAAIRGAVADGIRVVKGSPVRLTPVHQTHLGREVGTLHGHRDQGTRCTDRQFTDNRTGQLDRWVQRAVGQCHHL